MKRDGTTGVPLLQLALLPRSVVVDRRRLLRRVIGGAAPTSRILQPHLSPGGGPHPQHRPRRHPTRPRQWPRPRAPLLPRLLRQG